jgi:hypothetical protein
MTWCLLPLRSLFLLLLCKIDAKTQQPNFLPYMAMTYLLCLLQRSELRRVNPNPWKRNRCKSSGANRLRGNTMHGSEMQVTEAQPVKRTTFGIGATSIVGQNIFDLPSFDVNSEIIQYSYTILTCYVAYPTVKKSPPKCKLSWQTTSENKIRHQNTHIYRQYLHINSSLTFQ